MSVLLPRFEDPKAATIYVLLLVVSDVAIFAAFGRWLIQKRVVAPIERVMAGAEGIAAGNYDQRLPPGETAEMTRLAEAVNHMAAHLISHQEQLAANIRSLQDTNRQLTEARDELVRAEKLVSVGRLGAGIAHEVGNPLSAILGYLALIGRSADGQTKELVSSAEGEARRIDRIVRGLLDYARPRDARVLPIEVNGVVEQTVELLSTQGSFGDVDVRLELAQDLPPVQADHYQLQQVLVNLLLNACDAMEGSAEPRIRVTTSTSRIRPVTYMPVRRRDDPPDIDYSHRRRFHESATIPRKEPFAPGGEVVQIVVEDNGPGIPSELINQIFEPFVTTKEPGEGTGLGLAVAARLVDGMGGTIRVESPDGEGAHFTIQLPAGDRDIDEVAEP